MALTREALASHILEGFEEAFTPRARLGIMACLAAEEQRTFLELKAALDLTDGNLSFHLNYLERKGYLRSSELSKGKSRRKVYRATPLGRKALKAARNKVHELFHELMEGD